MFNGSHIHRAHRRNQIQIVELSSRCFFIAHSRNYVGGFETLNDANYNESIDNAIVNVVSRMKISLLTFLYRHPLRHSIHRIVYCIYTDSTRLVLKRVSMQSIWWTAPATNSMTYHDQCPFLYSKWHSFEILLLD